MTKMTLEYLSQKFCEHNVKYRKDHQQWRDEWKANYGDTAPMPDHLTDEFSLSEALEAICLEIIKIKKDLI